MAEKVTSMRLNDEDLEQFKAFAKDNGLNQQQAFNSLIALAELEKAKDVLGDRANSINTFRDTINKLLNFYVNALEENTTTEQTIREELQKELSTKDNTISTLYEQVQDLKADNETFKGNEKIKDTIIKQASEEVKKLQKDIEDKQSQLDIANRNNNNLQDQVAEYKQYKDNYKTIEKDLEQLKANNTTLITDKTTLENSKKQLQDKIKNDSDMIEFYKSNITELKKDIDTYKKDVKSLEEKKDKQIESIKEDYKKELQEREKALKDKYDLEIQKLKNEIEQLKSKDHKPGTVKTNNNK